MFVFNNNVYGMTGGQYSPTTPTGEFGTTAPYGVIDQDFDVCRLAIGAGATYVARGTAFHARQTVKLMADAISHCGFSVVDCASICPTYYGRKNKKGDAVDMLRWQRENTYFVERGAPKEGQDVSGKLLAGRFYLQRAPGIHASSMRRLSPACGRREANERGKDHRRPSRRLRRAGRHSPALSF